MAGARRRRFAWLIGILAALSGGIVGWLFSWSGPEVFSSVPSLAILGLGYPRATTGAGRTALIRCAPVVVVIGAVWLLLALAIDLLLRLSQSNAWQIYRSGEVWIDLRFYIGWSLGLLFTPAPRDTPKPQDRNSDP